MDTLFFDLDGTILDIQDRYYRIYADSLTFLGGSPMPKQEYWDLKRENTPEDEILAITGDSSLYEIYRSERRPKIESQNYLEMDLVWQNLYSCLSNLQSNFELILVTIRKNQENLEWQLNKLKLDLLFPTVLSPAKDQNSAYSEETKVMLIRSFMRNRRFSGWVIGDMEVDILAGKSLGIDTCAVSLGMRSKEFLLNLHPDILVENQQDYLIWLSNLPYSK